MPTISQFFGVSVRMYFDEHARPHFHAYYGSDAVVIEIDTLHIQEGRLPRRALGMVLEWAVEHRDELKDNWQRAERHERLNAIAPLE